MTYDIYDLSAATRPAALRRLTGRGGGEAGRRGGGDER